MEARRGKSIWGPDTGSGASVAECGPGVWLGEGDGDGWEVRLKERGGVRGERG